MKKALGGTVFMGKSAFLKTISIILSCTILTGCGSVSNILGNKNSTLTFDTKDPALALVSDFDAQGASPLVLVDQNGYMIGAVKEAIVISDNTLQNFEIKRTSDDSTVFTGSLEKSKKGSNNESTFYATFTDFQTEGEYYIYVDGCGQSPAFTIGEDVYEDIYKSALKQFYLNRCGVSLPSEYAGDMSRGICHSSIATLQENSAITLDVTGGWHINENADRDVVTGCKVIDNMLLAYEMNKNSFTDDVGIPESGNGIPDILDEVKFEIDWLLKMQTDDGGVYASALTDAENGENLTLADIVVTPVSATATIDFAASLAYFSYIYEEYDADFAAVCLEKAKLSFDCFKGFASASDYDESFLAAAILYRITGEKKYENVLALYFQNESFYESFTVNENYFLGGVTYLMTNQKVNTSICSQLMNKLMERAETIVNESTSSNYMIYIQSEDISELTSDIITNMLCMSVTNHILSSSEYTMLIEDHAHFLLGRNMYGANLVSDKTEYTYKDAGLSNGILYTPVQDAKFLVLIGAIK